MLPLHEAPPSSKRLQAAIEAVNRGLKKTSQAAARQGEERYLKLLLHHSVLSVVEQSIVLTASEWRTRGLHAARQRKFDLATELLDKARSVGTAASASRQCRGLCHSFQRATEAYLDYCLERFQDARERLYEALLVDADLETGSGYELLHLHRIQLLHNLVRLAARQGRKQEALHLAWRLLGYMEGKQQALPGPVSWDVQAISRLPADLVRGMFDQVAAEIAVLVARPTPDREIQFARAAADHLDLGEDSGCRCFPIAHAWLKLKRLFIQDRRVFLTCCCSFLEDRYVDHAVLWYATALDLLAVFKDFDSNTAQWLALDLAWERMPSALEEALEELMQQ